jgi:NTE family protein
MKRAQLITLFMLVFVAARAQQRPKIGLCLSGGGAKGLAHIGLLKVIDSAGIKIDYITGTSMGAVLGGLYAIGYTGNELEVIARDARWGVLFSNHVPMTDINIEEKDEFGRYLAELPMVGLKPSLPLGAIEGQQLYRMLSDLTFQVHQISQFDSLPIPFRCIGADIITGDAVVIKDGYLPTAMRASMAIPSVFTPVKWRSHLLVDGGLVRNFPVTDVKEMGADIVIGGYTGGRLFTEDELNSALKVIYQSASFNRVADSEMQKGLCNFLTDYDKELQDYSTASFRNTDSIIEIGYRVALSMYPRLKRLADSLNAFGHIGHDSLQKYYSKDVCISKIILDGASPESRDLVMGKLGLHENGSYKVAELNNAINMVYGTRFFDKVYYTLEATPYGNQLVIHLQESRRAAFKFALHYDNEQAAGILLNLTLRNILGNSSRVLVTADVSEYPKVRVNYQKFINKAQNLWVTGTYHYEFIPYRLYNFGRLQEELTNSYNNINAGLNKTLTKHSYVGVGIYRELNFTRTKIYPEDRANPDSFSFRNLSSREWGVSAIYMHNTLNKFLFPTKGSKLFVVAKYVPRHYYTDNFYVLNSSNPDKKVDINSLVTQALKVSATLDVMTRLSHRITIVNNFFAGFVFDLQFRGENREPYSAGALPGLYFAGGLQQYRRENLVPFTGYRETELVGAQMLVWNGGVQMEPIKKLFITPRISFLAAGGGFSEYIKNIYNLNFKYQDFSKGATHVAGYGITFAYNWFGGPISFTLYRATGVQVTRGYLTYGFKF